VHAIPIGERVELLEITQRVVGLVLDPGAHARLQAAMAGGEWTRRQRLAVLDGEHARLVVANRDQDRR
jgi:hypothetical protein